MTADPRFWDALAEEYSRKPVELPEAFEKKIAITQSLMRPEHVIADIGCGTGSLALRLAPHAAHVHGLDLSGEMIRIAKGKAADQGVDNVTFHTGAFDGSVPFAAESLHGLCAYSLLHLVDDRAAALARIWELLAPGGYFVSSTVCLGGGWFPYGAMLTMMKWAGKAPDVSVFGREQWTEEVRQAGFVDLREPDVGAKQQTAFMVAFKPTE